MIKNECDKSVDVGKVWWFWFTTSAFDVDKRLRRLFPICRMTRVVNSVTPVQGVGGAVVRALFGKQRSVMNPASVHVR